MSDYEIHEEVSDHKFHTQIPNLVVDLIELGFLHRNDFIVYSVIKRIAGDEGKCIYSLKNLAKKCGFHKDTVRDSLKRLEMKIPIIEKSLILVYEQSSMSGGDIPCKITICDVWRENGDFYREKLRIKKEIKGVARNDPPRVARNDTGGSWKRHKEEPVEEEPNSFKKPTNPTLPKNKKAGWLAGSSAAHKKEETKSAKAPVEFEMLKTMLLNLKLKEREDWRCPYEIEQFSEKEVASFLKTYSIEYLENALCYMQSCQTRKSKKPKPIDSEKGYFKTILKNGWGQ